MKFFISDAFTDSLFGGNPAGLVIIPEGQDYPADSVMLKTAAELRYSETAFIRRCTKDTFELRYFTPADEVALCGHATIAAFDMLKKEGYVKTGQTCTAITKAGKLSIDIKDDTVMMEMAKPVLIRTIDDTAVIKRLCDISGAVPMEGHFPKTISTGLPDILMPVADRRVLNGMKPDMEALAEFSKSTDTVSLHAFAVEEDGIYARDFAPLYGIPEEAATGTASGALIYYLMLDGMINPPAAKVFVQGEAMGRPSEITAEIILKDDGTPSVKVGGSAVIIAKGEIDI